MTQNGNLIVKRVAVESLHQDPSNARTHDERNVAAIQASLKTFGQVEPLVVQKGTGRIIGGNGRLEAVKNLGQTEVDIVEVECDDMTATALGIALNRTSELASWDDDVLAGHLKALADADFDELVTGFDMKEIEALISGAAGEVVEDEVPGPPADPITKPGDLWVLGEHRVLCGDATKAEDVARVLGGTVPFIMVTDPPYGVQYDPAWRQEAADKGIIGFSPSALGDVPNDDRVDWEAAYRLFRGDVAYVWHADKFACEVVAGLVNSGFSIRSQLIWRKSSFAISRGHYNWQHEPCWYAVREGRPAHWSGAKNESTVWDIPHVKNETGLGVQKPLECMARPIRNHGGKDDHVYDPFLGSGTTLIAAEQLGRRCYGLEIEPRYVDVVIQRWENLTGKKADRTRMETADGQVK